jgi:hypothetical protein
MSIVLRIYQFSVNVDENNIEKFSSTLQRVEFDEKGATVNATDKIVLTDEAGAAIQTLLNDHVAVQKLPKQAAFPVRVDDKGNPLSPGDFAGVGEPPPHFVDSNLLVGTPNEAVSKKDLPPSTAAEKKAEEKKADAEAKAEAEHSKPLAKKK